MKIAADIISTVKDVIQPECLSGSGCRQLEGFVATKKLTSPEREELLARCVEYCLSRGTQEACVITDSIRVPESNVLGELDA